MPIEASICHPLALYSLKRGSFHVWASLDHEICQSLVTSFAQKESEQDFFEKKVSSQSKFLMQF